MLKMKSHSAAAGRFLFLLSVVLGTVTMPALAQENTSHIRKNIPANMLPKNIATSFHRRSVDSKKAPWHSVGRVNVNGTIHCSGTLVGPKVVLTAAHCIFSKRLQKMVSPSVIHFLAGYAHGEYIAHARVVSYATSPAFNGKLGSDPANLPFDWALLVLDENLGDTLGFIELHPLLKLKAGDTNNAPSPHPPILPTSQVTTAGYPKDRAHILSLEEDCGIKKVLSKGYVFVTNCIAIQGDSGGPVLQRENDKWVIIGAQTGATKAGNTHLGIGVSALAFRAEMQTLQNYVIIN